MAWLEKFLSVAGGGAHDGSSEANAFTLAEAITDSATVADGTIYWWKTDTYTLAGDLTVNGAGSAGGIIWWKGYNTTPGDIDADDENAITKPLIDCQTNHVIVSGAFQWFWGLRITSAENSSGSGTVSVNAADTRYHRCHIIGTANDADCRAINLTGASDRTTITECYFSAHTTATECILAADNCTIRDCTVLGGADGIRASAVSASIVNCIIANQADDGISSSTGNYTVNRCSFYNQGGDGIEVTSNTGMIDVTNCIFQDATGFAINSSGGTTGNIFIKDCSYFSNGGVLNGIHENLQFGAINESSSPFVDAAGGDFTLVSGALSRGAGTPGTFENTDIVSYTDRGAVQSQGEGGGSSQLIPNFNGNLQ